MSHPDVSLVNILLSITRVSLVQNKCVFCQLCVYYNIYILAKYPSVGRVSAMVLRCHVQSHKQQTCLLARLMEFRACLNDFQNEHVHLTTSVEVAGSSTLPAHKNTYELEHRNGVIKMFFQHEIVTHYHSCQHGVRK